MTSEGLPGFFGKVPAVGDFVSRRLPRTFLNPWDQWLQSAIARSREQLATAWLDNYLGSPIWRFALSPGVAGPLSCTGILMPSVDRAGRYFPFTLAGFLPAGVNLFELAGNSQHWYEEAEAVALSVLEQTPPDMESLDRQVLELGMVDAGAAEDNEGGSSERPENESKPWHCPMSSVSGMADVLPELVRRLTELRFGAYSLWWSSGSEQIEPAMLVCEGLPPASGYAAMIGGGWQRYGWGNVPAMTANDRTEHEPSSGADP